MLIAAAFVAVGNGIILQSPACVVFPTATLAMLVYAVYAAQSTGAGADAWARGAAAFTAGIGTAILPRWVKAPSSAMSITSFLVLLPGALLYQGIWGSSLSGGQALYYLSSTFIAALSLAAGLIVGQYVGVVVVNALKVVRNRIFTPVFSSLAPSHPLTRRGGATPTRRTRRPWGTTATATAHGSRHPERSTPRTDGVGDGARQAGPADTLPHPDGLLASPGNGTPARWTALLPAG
ncbi:threonine/serine exporter family protein [Kocuria indica]|uniref:threonine/serine exporter family protein n=1 Tax=Kocuria marina TaxID=223184 RepID=UPI0016424027|nr:threonine/serine exporter family protein [Kocuria indica]MCG7432370.1 threonine/serine exporter family protein [Kocuria indica]